MRARRLGLETSRTLGAVMPLVGSTNPPCQQVPIGVSSAGGVFCFDPFELYEQGVLQSPNMVVLGQLGKGKSSLVKSLLMRSAKLGRSYFILDPKGEYGALAEFDGATHISLGGSNSKVINPLYRPPLSGHERRVDLNERLVHVSGALTKSQPTSLERLILRQVSESLTGSSTPLGVRAVVDAITEVTFDESEVTSDARSALSQARVGLRSQFLRMVDGDLSRVFGDSDALGELPSRVVVDLSELYGTELLAFVVNVLVERRLSQLRSGVLSRGFVVVDEAWAVLDDPVVSRWFRSLWKLARSYGSSNIAVTHRISDLEALDGDSQSTKAMMGDAESFVVFGQSSFEAESTARYLGLSSELANSIERLPRGVALWKVNQAKYLVRHHLSTEERPVVDTDHKIRDHRV